MPTISQAQERLEALLDDRYALCHYDNLTEEQKKANKIYYNGVAAAIGSIGEWHRYPDGTHLVSLYNIVPDKWDEDNDEEWE